MNEVSPRQSGGRISAAPGEKQQKSPDQGQKASLATLKTEANSTG
jgi:hypothetical protein